MSVSQKLVAVRTAPKGPPGLENVPAAFEVARLDPNAPGQIGICDSLGIFRLGALSVEQHRIIIQASFYLQHLEGGQLVNIPQVPWTDFNFLAARPGEILFCQSGGNQLLFLKLPLEGSQFMSQIFLFGAHRAPISSFLMNASGVLVVSGSEDGALKLWDVTSGDLLDHSPNAHSATPNCMQFMGPFMVVIGWSDGHFGLWDVASSQLIQTNKISMGPNGISCISTFVPDNILSGVSTARGLSRPSTGGGILSGIPRLPGRQYSHRDDARKPRFPDAGSTLIAVGCEGGTVAVWAPSSSSNNWEVRFSIPRCENHTPIKLAFAPCGNLLQVVAGVGNTSVVFSHNTSTGEVLSGHSTHGIPTLCEFINQAPPSLLSSHPFGPCPAKSPSRTVMLTVLKFGTPCVVVFPLPSLDRDQHSSNAERCSRSQSRCSGGELGSGFGIEGKSYGELHTASLRAGLEDRLKRLESLSLANVQDIITTSGPQAAGRSDGEVQFGSGEPADESLGHSGSDEEDMVVPEPRATPINLIPIAKSSFKDTPVLGRCSDETIPQAKGLHAQAGGQAEARYSHTCEPMQPNHSTSRTQESPDKGQSSESNGNTPSHGAFPAFTHRIGGIDKDKSKTMPNRMPQSGPMRGDWSGVEHQHPEPHFQPGNAPTKLPQGKPQKTGRTSSSVGAQNPIPESQPKWRVERHHSKTRLCKFPTPQPIHQAGEVLGGSVSDPQSDICTGENGMADGDVNDCHLSRLIQFSAKGCSPSPCQGSDGKNKFSPSISGSFGTEGNDENQPPLGNSSTAAAEPEGTFAKPVLQSTNMAARRLERCRNEEFDSDQILSQDSVRKQIYEQAARGGDVPRNAKIFEQLKPIEPEVVPQVKRLVSKQLHPKWVAGQSRKPQMSDLWNPEDHQIEVCDTAPVHVPVKFSLRGLAKSLSRIPLDPKPRSHFLRDYH